MFLLTTAFLPLVVLRFLRRVLGALNSFLVLDGLYGCMVIGCATTLSV